MAGKMGKKFSDLLGRSKSKRAGSPSPLAGSSRSADIDLVHDTSEDSPEGRVERAVWLFCESGSASHGGEEVLQLPVIVDAAESSPKAAAVAAQQIRRLMGREWATKPHVQYNAIMLIRILTDNPGPSFSRNFDKSFVSTIKEALRMCKDASTQQILRETLDAHEANKQFQEGMEGLIQMWRKEKGHQASIPLPGGRNGPPHQYQGGAIAYSGPPAQGPQDTRHNSRQRQLPPAVELASRVEEARNTAKILLQLIQSTPAEELINNELIREFADRCQSAQRSMQGYIATDHPPPDDETMLTLIETNEQLSLASSRYQRSLLSARRAMGLSPSPNAEAMQKSATTVAATPVSPPLADAHLERKENLHAPPRSPPRATNNLSAFGSATETYQAPSHPPPSRTSGFAPPAQTTGYNTSSPPANAHSGLPSPPPAMLARLNSRDGQTSPLLGSAISNSSDPFADPFFTDPVENPAPLGYNANTHDYANSQYPAIHPHSKTFSVDAGPTYAAQQPTYPTTQLAHPAPVEDADDNPYDSSPKQTRSSATFAGVGSAPSLPRPYHTNGPTPSYLNRQASAADHMTMHDAGAAFGPPSTGGASIAEIDGHSEVGRTEPYHHPHQHPQPGLPRSDTARTDDTTSAYGVSPARTRASSQLN